MLHHLKQLKGDFEESARIAIEQLFAHKFRSLLTALGVIIGVWAVILIGVGIEGLNRGFAQSMNMLGPDNFYVNKWPWRDVGDDWPKYRNRRNLQPEYAAQFNEILAATPNPQLKIAVPQLTSRQNISYEDQTANGIQLIGTNADFSEVSAAELADGRLFNAPEALSASQVIILGHAVVKALFPEREDQAIGQRVYIQNHRFTVIGTLKEQGSFLGMHSFDRQAIMPLATIMKFLPRNPSRRNADIIVAKLPDADRDLARDEIEGIMRIVRGLQPGEDSDFEVNATDMIEEQIGPVKRNIAIGGFFITGLALFVGAIGIMNITFVSVKERTKEIGTRRAIGARRRSILIQFLVEAVSICLLGGLAGLLLAIGCKSLVDLFVPQFPAAFSPNLMILAVILSVLTGILSGFIPALQASKMDPATALRHE